VAGAPRRKRVSDDAVRLRLPVSGCSSSAIASAPSSAASGAPISAASGGAFFFFFFLGFFRASAGAGAAVAGASANVEHWFRTAGAVTLFRLSLIWESRLLCIYERCGGAQSGASQWARQEPVSQLRAFVRASVRRGVCASAFEVSCMRASACARAAERPRLASMLSAAVASLYGGSGARSRLWLEGLGPTQRRSDALVRLAQEQPHVILHIPQSVELHTLSGNTV
jgi:hypothetical protein